MGTLFYKLKKGISILYCDGPDVLLLLLEDGVPEYKTGNSYVVFLPKKSSLGFSSPIGLHQGSFSVSDINGEQIISNGKNLSAAIMTEKNKETHMPLAVVQDNPTRARLVDFINTIRVYNAP